MKQPDQGSRCLGGYVLPDEPEPVITIKVSELEQMFYSFRREAFKFFIIGWPKTGHDMTPDSRVIEELVRFKVLYAIEAMIKRVQKVAGPGTSSASSPYYEACPTPGPVLSPFLMLRRLSAKLNYGYRGVS